MDRTRREKEIFEAAYDVLAEKGYKGASMLAVARAAGASNETLYNWYGNKQGLLAAMIKANAAAAEQALSGLAADAASDQPIRRLEAFGVRLLELLTGERSIALNRAAAADVANGGTLGEMLAEHGRSRMVPLIVETIRSAQKAGLLRPHDPVEVAEIYVALLTGDLQIRRVIGVTQAPPAEVIAGHSQRVIDLLLDLFGTEA